MFAYLSYLRDLANCRLLVTSSWRRLVDWRWAVWGRWWRLVNWRRAVSRRLINWRRRVSGWWRRLIDRGGGVRRRLVNWRRRGVGRRLVDWGFGRRWAARQCRQLELLIGNPIVENSSEWQTRADDENRHHKPEDLESLHLGLFRGGGMQVIERSAKNWGGLIEVCESGADIVAMTLQQSKKHQLSLQSGSWWTKDRWVQ